MTIIQNLILLGENVVAIIRHDDLGLKIQLISESIATKEKFMLSRVFRAAEPLNIKPQEEIRDNI